MSRAGTGLGTGGPGTVAGSEAPGELRAGECQRIWGSGDLVAECCLRGDAGLLEGTGMCLRA